MKLKATTKYFLQDFKKAFIGYYITIIAILLVNIVLNLLFFSSGESYTSLDSVTVFFLFVVGLCSFKENFLMLTQMGVSRRTIFLGRMATAPIIALAMAVIDQLLTLLFRAITSGMPNLHIESSFYLDTAAGQSVTFTGVLYGALLAFLAYMFAIMLGNFITVLYYRLGTLGKVVVSIGVPVGFQGLFFLMAFASRGVAAATLEAFIRVAEWITYTVPGSGYVMPNLLLTLFLAAALLSGLGWLLTRRAVVKR